MPSDTFAPGAPANVTLRDVAPGAGTSIVRISRGAPSGSALFDSAPALLAVGMAATQISAPEGRTWHPWVDSTGEHAQVIGFERRSQPAARTSRSSKPTRKTCGGTLRTSTAPRSPCRCRARAERYTLSILDDHRRRAGDRGIVADNGAMNAVSMNAGY